MMTTRGATPNRRRALSAALGLGALLAALAAVVLTTLTSTASAAPGRIRLPLPVDSTSSSPPDSTSGAPTSSPPIGRRIGCLVDNQQPRQRTTDHAQCYHLAPSADGTLLVRQWQPRRNAFRFFHVGSFHTGPHGNALHVRFRVFPIIKPGVHKFVFETGRVHFVMFLNVKPAAAA